MVILVVDDEVLINLTTSDNLRREGHTVLSAHTADQAISILESRSDIQLIFTDIDMPRSMDGLKLAAAVRDRWPPVHIIVTSGHRRPGDSELPAAASFLAKPYHERELFNAIKSYA